MTGIEDILGYPVLTVTKDECVQEIANWIVDDNDCRWLACLNPHSYAVACDDRALSAALRDADWLIPDGTGIVIASRALGGTIRARVTGSDVFSGLNRHLNGMNGSSVFFVGSTEDTLSIIRTKMAHDFPNIRIAGTYSPPFKPAFDEEDTRLMVESINQANPDVLWVGMTAPKQEIWIHQHKDMLNVKFIGAIGAVFDFYAGRVKRSHPLFQRLGLEWLPRLMQEPRRLWRRMGISAPIFMWHLLIRIFHAKK